MGSLLPTIRPRLVVLAALASVTTVAAVAAPASARRGDSCREPYRSTLRNTDAIAHGDVRYVGGGILLRDNGYDLRWGVRNGAIMCKVVLYRTDGTRWSRVTSKAGRHYETRGGFLRAVFLARRRRATNTGFARQIGIKVADGPVP